jgi:hypothetical protein
LIPLVAETLPVSLSFYLISFLIVLLGSATSICQSSMVALSGMISENSVNSLLLGFGFSGLIISSFRLIFLACFPNSRTGYLISTMIYFFLSATASIICIFSIKKLLALPVVLESFKKIDSKFGFGVFNDIEMQNYGNNHLEKKIQESFSVYPELLKKIWEYLLLIFMNYVITFSLLCGIALKSKIE